MVQRRGKTTRIKVIGGEVTFSFSDPQMTTWLKPLSHYNTASSNFAAAFEEYAAYHERSIMRNFAAEGRPKRWRRLAQRTIQDRIEQGFPPGPILVRTGALKRGFRFEWGPRSYRVSNKMSYFMTHQEGDPANSVPARPMLVLLNQDKQRFTRIARRHLTGDES